MSKYDIFDLACNVKLGYLLGTVFGSDSYEHFCHAWYPGRQLKGEYVVRKGNLRSYFPRKFGSYTCHY